MLYDLGKLVWALANPGALLLLLLLTGAACLLLGWRRVGAGFVVACAALALGLTAAPVDRWLLAPLEGRFSAPEPMPDSIAGIVVLGGGIDVRTATGGLAHALNGAGDRVTAAAQLARRYPTAELVYASGARWPDRAAPAEATRAARLLAGLGVAPERVLLETRSRNTRENALFAHGVADPQPGETWVLVTSAFHMPRAVACFRAVGWEVLPYPVDRLLVPAAEVPAGAAPGGLGWFDGGLIDALVYADLALKEYLGLLAYRLVGHTQELFPAPKSSR